MEEGEVELEEEEEEEEEEKWSDKESSSFAYCSLVCCYPSMVIIIN
jgi:hypothetical protein